MADAESNPNKTPVIMKVDAAPNEEDEKQENDCNEAVENNTTSDITDTIKPSQICSPSNLSSRPLLASSRLSAPLLRPPQLGPGPTFALSPSRLNPVKEKPSNSNPSSHTNGETPLKFVPLVTDGKSPAVKQVTAPTTTSSVVGAPTTNFVFGQNLQERVIADGKKEEPKPSTSVMSNGTADMLFSSAAAEATEPKQPHNKEGKSLSESAREYEESRAVKRRFEEVEVRTGEEGETNVMQALCKLFSWDKAVGTWQERGRGNLRLNDFEVDDEEGERCTQSRLVFRTVGGLRVILNTKVWAEMTVQEASQKSIRLTAIDGNGEIKVFLIMACKEKIQQLYSELTSRVKKEIERQKNKKPSSAKREKLDTGGDN